ncbi:MAG TPA: aldo/keto reductase, partial [Prolixibacteraceae bacterium]|nr:aldo/keto reductase [Prolixibacteraceae bacterium]
YLPLVEKYGLSVFPYWALAAGFLTGKYRAKEDLSKSVRGAGVEKYLNEKGLSVLAALDQLAGKHHTQMATVSLAWLLHQPHVLAPIVSATNLSQLQPMIDAPKLKLDADDLALLDSVSK